jgi:hypothetical protein
MLRFERVQPAVDIDPVQLPFTGRLDGPDLAGSDICNFPPSRTTVAPGQTKRKRAEKGHFDRNRWDSKTRRALLTSARPATVARARPPTT